MVGENETIDIHLDSTVGVLLLHGLFGTPNELHVLGGEIARSGYRVRIPLLPGRGDQWDQLSRISWDDVERSAAAHLDDLAREHDRVVIGGLSAGGALALDLALRRRPSALLLYATPISLRHPAAAFAPYLWRVVPSWPMQVGGPVARDRVPVRPIAELVGAMRRVRSRLHEIDAPALIIHARGDPLVPLSSASQLERGLTGPSQLFVFDGTDHALTAGPERDRVAALTLAFLRTYVPLDARP